MNIGVLTSLFPLSTRPREGLFALQRWRHMAARGHRVRIVHPLPYAPLRWGPSAWRELGGVGAEETVDGLRVEHPRYLHLPRLALRNAAAFAARGVRSLLAGARPEVVLADYAWPAGVAARALQQAGLPCVISGRGSDVLQVAGEAGLREPLAAALRTAGHWCAVSQDLVERMDELAGRPGHGVLVPNGVDTDLFRPRDREAARRELGLESGSHIVLVVGHLIERKDPLLALRAFAQLAARDERARLVLVGRGPLEAGLRAEAASLGVSERTFFAGEREPWELARWYAAGDVLLLTSRREGRPNVVLEALASGRDVLATPAGGTVELLGQLPGSLCAERDERALAERLEGLLASPGDPLALAARVREFSWEASCARLETCLQRALEEAG